MSKTNQTRASWKYFPISLALITGLQREKEREGHAEGCMAHEIHFDRAVNARRGAGHSLRST